MEAFGVQADVDAMSRRRRVSCPEGAAATRAEVGRRAARYGDIVDQLHRRHFAAEGPAGSSLGPQLAGTAGGSTPLRRRLRAPAPPGAEARGGPAPKQGILPEASETYDEAGSGFGRRFFDESCRAQRYAELLGRAGGARLVPVTWDLSSCDLGDDPRLPLALRRVLRALLPRAGDPDFSGEAAEQLRAQVEAEALRRWKVSLAAGGGGGEGEPGGRRRGGARGPQQAEAAAEGAAAAGPGGEEAAGQGPAALLTAEAAPEHELPTLLLSRLRRRGPEATAAAGKEAAAPGEVGKEPA